MILDDDIDTSGDETDEDGASGATDTTAAAPAPTNGKWQPTPDQAASPGGQNIGNPFVETEHKYGLPPGLLEAMAQTESGMNPGAVSPQGAEGIMQFMPGTAKGMGVNPWNVPEAVDGAGKYMRQSLDKYGGDIDQALMSYHGGYDQSAWGPKTHAYPGAVLANLPAGSTDQKPQDQAPTQTAAGSGSDILDLLNQRYGAESPASRLVGPIPKPKPGDDITQMLDQRYGGQDPTTQATQKFGPPSDPSLTQQFAHALSYGPGQLWRGLFVDAVSGWTSLINGVNNAAAKDPNLALAIADPMAANEVAARNGSLLPTNPNGQNPVPLPGESAIRTLGGLLPKSATATPAELGDRDWGSTLVSDLSRGAGWVMGAGGAVGDIGNAIRALGASRYVAALGNLLKSPAIGAATFGVGQNIAHDLSGQGETTGEKMTGALIGTGLDALRVGAFHGGSALLHGGAGAYRTWLGRLVSPKAVLQSTADNPAAAEANLSLPAGIEATGTTLVPGGAVSRSYPAGFQVPAAIQTADQGLQALHSVMSTYDATVNSRFRELLQGNTNSILDEARQLAGGATREDAIGWLDKMDDARGDLINQRLIAAQQEADRTTAAAVRDTQTGQAAHDAQLLHGALIQGELMHASEDIRAMAQSQYHAAEQAGAMTAPVQANNVYDAVRAAATDQARMGEGGTHFPWDTVQRLYKQDPRAMMAAGKTEEQAFGPQNWKPGALDNVQQLNSLRSDLLDTVRDERAKWSMPGGAGDRRLMGWASQLAEAGRSEIERATTEAGNNQLLVNANRAFKQWNDTFNSGILGKITAHDYQGISDIAPEQILGRFLANSDAARANVGRLYDAVGQISAQGHPVDTLMGAFKSAVRQDFANALNARPDGGAGAQAWITSHARLFGPDAPQALQQMGQEFKTAADNAASLQSVERQSTQAYADFASKDANRVGAFLGADPGRELDVALRGDVSKGMRQLLNVTKNDPTGGATRGLAGMLAERLLSQGSVPDAMAGELGTYSGAGVKNWWNQTGQRAFAELDKELPGSAARAQRIVDAMGALDRMRLKPGVPLSQSDAKLATSSFAQVAAQLFGASVGRELYKRLGIGGGIQTPAIGSNFAVQMLNRVSGKIDKLKAGNILRDALTSPDPTMLRDLMRPLDSQEAVDKASGWLEHAYLPLYGAAPTAIRSNLNTVNEQTPNTGPSTAGMPGARLRGSIPISGAGAGAR